MNVSLRTMLVAVLISAAVFARSVPRDPETPITLGLDGFCPVTLTDERWQKGDGQFASVYQGCYYLFTGAAEKTKFDGAPAIYAPVASGLDVVVLQDEGRRVRGRRNHGLWYHGRVYVFASEESLEKFAANAENYHAKYSDPAETPLWR